MYGIRVHKLVWGFTMIAVEMEWNGGVDSSLEALKAMKVKWRGNLEEKSIIGKEARGVLGRD